MSDLKARAAAAAAGPTELDVAAGERNGFIAPADGTVAPPDVNASGIVVDPQASVFAAWSRVMEEVEYVKKTKEKGSQLNYAFRGIDAVLNAVGPALRKHGVIVMPVDIDVQYSTITSAKGTAMHYCRATVTFGIFGPQGDTFPARGKVVGEAFDTGDKASTKAQSIALRTFLINALAIPTNEPERDTEYGEQHQVGGPPPRTADSYLQEILDPKVELIRLHQIRGEFGTRPDIAGSKHTLFDGREVVLRDLLAQVGKAKQGTS